MSASSNVWSQLARSKAFREEFAALQLKRGVPFQIRALLKQRGWKQEDLAERAHLSQGVVSRAQNPSYGNLTINTIARIAAGFDVAFIGTFVPFSELVKWFETLSEESGRIETFEEEARELSQRTRKPSIVRIRRDRQAKRSRQIRSTKASEMSQLPEGEGRWISEQVLSGHGQLQKSFGFEPEARPGAAATIIEITNKVGAIPRMFSFTLNAAVGAGGKYGQ